MKRNFLRRFLYLVVRLCFSLFTTGITTIDRFFMKGAWFRTTWILCDRSNGIYYVDVGAYFITGAVYPKFVGMVNQDLKDRVKQYSFYIEIMCLIVSYIVYFTIPYLIKWVMPEYLPSIPIIQVLIVAFVVYASTQLRYMDIIRKKA